MKRRFFMLAVAVYTCVAGQVQAQSMGVGKNVLYIGVGPGFGYERGYYNDRGAGYDHHSTPSFQLGFEHGISESVPQSIIGLGGHMSAWFAGSSYRDDHGRGWDEHWSDFTVAAKGFYHYKPLVHERWDLYASLLAGLKFRGYNFTATGPDYYYARESYSSVAPALGVGIGGRVYVTDTFGFYGELGVGYNADYAQIGCAFKF